MAESLRLAAQSVPDPDGIGTGEPASAMASKAEASRLGLGPTANPSDSLAATSAGRWSSRFALAAVSLAGLVGGNGAARAAVQYGYGPLSIGLQNHNSNPVGWDVDGGGDDFALTFSTFNSAASQQRIRIKALNNSNGLLASSSGQVLRLPAGAIIDPSDPNQPFPASTSPGFAMISATTGQTAIQIRPGLSFQQFASPNNSGYFGFRFTSNNGADYNYGYAALSLDLVHGIATITAWAWETTANASITVGPLAATPAPAALGGLLALGAGGLRRLRSLRRAAATAESTAGSGSGDTAAPLNS